MDNTGSNRDVSKKGRKNETNLRLINTNTRSLCPKIDSFFDCVKETDTNLAIVTETWMKNDMMDGLREDFLEGEGFRVAARNREVGGNGVAYGGVAVFWRDSFVRMAGIDLKNPDKYEVVVAAGSMKGHTRKLVVIGCYIPPNYTKKRAEGALDFIADRVVDLKRRYKDPYLIVGGDFNQWRIGDALLDFADLNEVKVGCTRKDKEIDRLFTNTTRSITDYGTLSPLTADSEAASDHRVSYFWATLKKKETFVWEKYTYRPYTAAKAEKFKEWAVLHDWEEVLGVEGSDTKADAYQATIEAALDRYFPTKTTKRKSTDCPWMDNKTRKAIRDRKTLFFEEGGIRTDLWKEEKKKTERMVRDRKREFMDNQRNHILAADANRNFYKHVKNFNKLEKPAVFDVRTLIPNKTDKAVAEDLAEFFIKVSREFEPLTLDQVPRTCLLYTSPSPRDRQKSRMPSSA